MTQFEVSQNGTVSKETVHTVIYDMLDLFHSSAVFCVLGAGFCMSFAIDLFCLSKRLQGLSTQRFFSPFC